MAWYKPTWFSGRPAGMQTTNSRVEPQVKSFFDNSLHGAFDDNSEKAFDILRGITALNKYEICPPLAIGLNKITQAIASLDIYFYQNEAIVKNDQVAALINQFKKRRDLAEYVRDVQCAGRGYIVLVGNINYPPSKIRCIRQHEVSAFEDVNKNIYKLDVPIGLYSGIYDQAEYDSDVYYSRDKLRTIILVRNQISDFPLSPLSASINIIYEGYNHNYKTVKNGGRVASHYQFKDEVSDDELHSRKQQIKANKDGITISSGGELDIKEFGLTARDMEWSNQLKTATNEVYNFLEIPLSLMNTDATTFNNLSVGNAQLYENKVLPFCDYLFGRIGDVLAPLFKLKNVQMMANRENIDALIEKRVAALAVRAGIKIETTDELRSLLDNRPPVEGGDKVLVSSLSVPLDTIGNPITSLT